jgi:4-aminobutyrate aminotransferase-like enzyme/Ser/Thr protein kinase RdoA (MazF antagonist)/murein DD-endopeptidase MepM/ murein hydrolase activator NlpD
VNEPSNDLRPHLSKVQALELLESHFGLAGDIEPLPSWRDQNFKVAIDSGERFILKIANGDEPISLLELQADALAFLASCDLGIGLPRIVPTASGGRGLATPGQDGASHWVRLLTYVPGEVLGAIKPRTPALLDSLGEVLGRLDSELAHFDHPSAERPDSMWDLTCGGEVMASHVHHIQHKGRRAQIEALTAELEAQVIPLLADVPRSVIHNDANDYNVLVSPPTAEGRQVVGLLDFGDLLESATVCEIAIGGAYALMGVPDPMAALLAVVRGYHRARPLTEPELEILFPLIRARLGVSVCVSASKAGEEMADGYLTISEAPAWEALSRLDEVHPRLARNLFRDACGLEPCPRHHAVTDWIETNQKEMGPVVSQGLDDALVFDLSAASPEIDDLDRVLDPEKFSKDLVRRLEDADATVGIGRYAEPRMWYASDSYGQAAGEFPERRTVHTAIDVFLPAGSPVLAPLEGRVLSLKHNSDRLDYGPTIILKHAPEGGPTFYTLYGHLTEESLEGSEVGSPVERGQEIAQLGDFPENGDWPPHLHFQVITDLLDEEGTFPGVALPSQQNVWLSMSPDPSIMLALPPGSAFEPPTPRHEIKALRREHLASSLTLTYDEPLHVVRGWKQHLIDADGQAYLDAVNNVCHVGHCHPRVVEAGQKQMGILNTNTRYLHEMLGRYCERLTATLPDPLSVCFLVNSGSEANELALRIARAHTQRDDFIVVTGGYHGNTGAAVSVSPYKFEGPGGEGAAPHIHAVPMPDDYRGQFRRSDPDRGLKFAGLLVEAVDASNRRAFGPAAFISESLLSCGGQIELPPGYLEAAYALVHRQGGVCICDEVQVGFGRVGSHFWGFETQGVVPDIVTMGKPIGNGHPLGAVVTTPEIAASFANGMEYFNTFGGNPVSCAIGLAVLDVIEEEGLQRHAGRIGEHLLKGLRSLMDRHPAVGDARGRGLFLGIEMVADRGTREPNPAVAKYVVERMKNHGILLSTDGPDRNVIKIKPPLVFDRTDADRLLEVMDRVLSEDYVDRSCAREAP